MELTQAQIDDAVNSVNGIDTKTINDIEYYVLNNSGLIEYIFELIKQRGKQ